MIMRPTTATLIIFVTFSASLSLSGGEPAGLTFLGAAQHARSAGVPGETTRISVAGGLAAVAAGTDGLQLFDVGNPAEPVFAGQMLTALWGGLYARDVKLLGTTAYVAADAGGLEIIDVTNPAFPKRVGGYRPTGIASAVLVSGPYAYLADGEGGLHVLSISDPASIWEAGRFPRSMLDELMAQDVRVSGEYAYVVGTKGLTILRLSNLDDIRIVGQFPVAVGAGALDLSGTHAFIIGNDGSLMTINVASPSSPVLVSRYPQAPTPGLFTSVQVDETRAYLSCGTNGVQVLDVSNPASPVPAGGLVTFGNAQGLSAAGDRLYVAEGAAGFVILRKVVGGTLVPPAVSGPEDQIIPQGSTARFAVTVAQPQQLSFQWLWNGLPIGGGTTSTLTITNVDSSQAGYYEVAVGNAGGSVMSRVALLKPVFPPVFLKQPFDWAVLEGDSFVEGASVGPLGPFQYPWMVGPFYYQWRFNGQMIPGATNEVLALNEMTTDQAGAYSVAVTNVAGMIVSRDASVRVHAKVSPKQVAQWAQPANDVQAVGDLVYLACGTDGVQILEVSDVTRPTLVGHIPSQGESRALRVVGSIAYIADGKKGGLAAVDVSDPSQPKRLSNLVTGDSIDSVTTVGLNAYVTTGTEGMAIIDISDPTNMVKTAAAKTSDVKALDVDADGLFAYLAAGTNGCRVYYVGDHHAAIAVNVYLYDFRYIPEAVRGVKAIGNYLYMAHSYGGLEVLDVTDPRNPSNVTSAGGYASGLQAAGKFAFVQIGQEIAVFNLEFPSRLIKVGTCPVGGKAYAVLGSHVFVATGSQVVVLDIGQTPVPPVVRITSEWLRSTGQIKLRMNGAGPFVLQGSSNLTQWLSLTTNSVPGTDGVFEFIQNVEPQQRAQFYRAVQR